jgi:di/tricarboxylate transporter
MAPRRLAPHHIVTLACMVCLVASVIGCVLAGVEPDIGVLAFAFGALLTLIYPSCATPAFARIDWSTVFVVGGIVTFVGVLQKLGAIDLLGHGAVSVGTPLLAALVICITAGLVSAFASTTGILAALVPLAVPLATSGGVSDWALISALSVCAAIVDVSPFSTTGATLVASAPETERAHVRTMTLRWGMSMVIVGPVAFTILLLVLRTS